MIGDDIKTDAHHDILCYTDAVKSIVSIDCRLCHSRGHSIFCDLNDEKLSYLTAHKTTRIYKKHEMIFREGEVPKGLFCVFGGLIKIFKTSREGKEQIVRLSKDGDVLGYRSFFSQQPYAASAQAVQECTVCFIEKEGIEKLIKNAPDIVYSFLKKLCRELGESEQKFQDVVSKSVSLRLSHLLKLLFQNEGQKSMELPLSREEIASLIGARPETVIRTFSKWKEEGLISVKAKQISILKPKILFLQK